MDFRIPELVEANDPTEPLKEQDINVSSNVSTNANHVVAKQDVELIFQIAWGPNGNLYTRLLSLLITSSAALRVLCNLVLVLALGIRKALRNSKQHLLIMYMALFDFADGCWYFCMVGLDYGARTRLQCLLTLRHALWFIFGGQGAAIMLTVISMDRFMAVWKPMWYRSQGPGLSHKLALVVLIWTLIFGSYLVYVPVSRPDDMVQFCLTSHTFMEAFDLDGLFRKIWLILSVLLYGGVVFVYRLHVGQRTSTVNCIEASERRKASELAKINKIQNKITVSLGISSAITLFLNVVPLALWHWIRAAYPSLQQMGYILFSLINWSSAVNVILFYKRHAEIKTAIRSMFTCRKMPSKLDDWTATIPLSRQSHPSIAPGAGTDIHGSGQGRGGVQRDGIRQWHHSEYIQPIGNTIPQSVVHTSMMPERICMQIELT